jgi:tetratricopeptide (TPR) repeat protein
MFQTFQTYFSRYRAGRHVGNVLYFMAWYHAEKQQQYERAAILYEQCTKTPGDYRATALYHLAHLYHRLSTTAAADGRKDDATAYLTKAAEAFLSLIRKAPGQLTDPQEYRWTGDTFLKLRRHAESIEAYEALLALGTKPDTSRDERMRRFIREGGSPNIIYWLGKLHLESKTPDPEAAIAYFTFFDTNLKDHEYFIWAKLGLAEALKAAGRHDDASLCYQRVESLAPHVLKDPDVRDGLVLRCQLQLGRMFYEDKKDDHALKYLLRVGMLAEGAEGGEALYMAAHAAHRSRDPESTLGIAQRLVREQPDSTWGKRLLAELPDLGLRLSDDGKTLELIAKAQ